MLYALMLYALKTGGCLAAFYLVFKLFLSRETFHRLNRVVVLSVLVLSFVMPFCGVKIYREVQLEENALETLPALPVEALQPLESSFPWQEVLGALFLLGVLGVVVRLVCSTLTLWRVVRQAQPCAERQGLKIVRSNHPQAPFSWFCYVVVGEDDLDENGDAILAHEEAHVLLGHSWDLLLFDVLGAMQWFNPALWLLRRELKAIHEYEADRAVLEGGFNARAYQLLLIKKAAGERWYSVANSFNHSKLKNRITMMIQKQSSRWAAAKVLLLLPLVGVAMGAFAETVYVVSEDKDTTKNEISQPAAASQLKVRVVDTTGAPIMGVVVMKQGTGEGICTDKQGRGVLNVKSGDRLICSMIGKESLDYVVGELSDEELTLTMQDEEVEIDEIKVVRYSAQEIEKAKKEIERGKVEFEQAKQEIEAAKQEMEAVKREIEAAKREAEAAKQEMGQAKADLETSKADLETAKAEFVQAKAAADEEVFMIVESMPKFEGGDINTFRRWVQMRVQYPKELQEAGIGGRVVVSFTVEKDGSVSDVQTRRTPDTRLSDGVVALIKQSPKWEPGRQRGVAVRVQYTLPIDFATK